jgi:hypothetical protein
MEQTDRMRPLVKKTNFSEKKQSKKITEKNCNKMCRPLSSTKYKV